MLAIPSERKLLQELCEGSDACEIAWKNKEMYDEFSHAIHDAAERRGRITINKQKGKN